MAAPVYSEVGGAGTASVEAQDDGPDQEDNIAGKGVGRLPGKDLPIGGWLLHVVRQGLCRVPIRDTADWDDWYRLGSRPSKPAVEGVRGVHVILIGIIPAVGSQEIGLFPKGKGWGQQIEPFVYS